MTRSLSVILLAGLSLALGACATPAGVDWSKPETPLVTYPPTFLHNMVIVNPPHPQVLYADYMEEPTRFVFRPKNIVWLEEEDQGADNGGDMGGYDDGGGYDGGGGGGTEE
jgi:hypothetical protein